MSTEKTPVPPAPKAADKPAGAGKAHGPDALKTEQEKGGKDPITPAAPSPGPVETIEDQEIGPRDPYPTKED